jgi:hypothetical protein
MSCLIRDHGDLVGPAFIVLESEPADLEVADYKLHLNFIDVPTNQLERYHNI